jgi:hypothetical protein
MTSQDRTPPSAIPRKDKWLRALLCDVAQILDGWHADGTVWSEWDESVRERVGMALRALEPTPSPEPPAAAQDEPEWSGEWPAGRNVSPAPEVGTAPVADETEGGREPCPTSGCIQGAAHWGACDSEWSHYCHDPSCGRRP